MAGETALSANSSTGVYLLIDNNGWVAANTPNSCNLGGDSGLIEGSGYMYFPDFISLVEIGSTPNNTDNIGWHFTQNLSTLLRTESYTGQGVVKNIVLDVQVDSSEQSAFVKFFEIHNQVNASSYQLYLVRQWASTTFREFSYNMTLKKYAAVALTGYNLTEANRGGKFVMTLQIAMASAYRLTSLG